MTNLSRITAKIFGETAAAIGDDPEIGQFGSALAGTYVGTTDVATIQSLPAWSNGFIDSVTPSTQFPPLPEMTGFGKVLSHQNAYLLQKGVAEWDSGTTYYTGDFCKGVGEGKLYASKVDNNINHAVTDETYWEVYADISNKADIDLSNCTKPYITETHHSGTSGYFILSDKTCEQWGKTTSANVTFSKVYGSQPNVVLTVISSSAGYRNLSAAPSTTGFTIFGTVNSTYPVEWRAIGKLA